MNFRPKSKIQTFFPPKKFFRIQLPDKKCFFRFVSPEIRISRIRNSTLYNPNHEQRWSRRHKARGQSHGQGNKKIRGQGQECSRPRPRTKDTNASVFLRKKVLKFFFRSISKKNGLEKHFPADLQNFNHSKNNAVLEPRTKGGGGGGGGMPQFCILFFANYTILATQRGGPWPNALPPQNTPLVLHINVNGIRKKISFYNSQTYWK